VLKTTVTIVVSTATSTEFSNQVQIGSESTMNRKLSRVGVDGHRWRAWPKMSSCGLNAVMTIW